MTQPCRPSSFEVEIETFWCRQIERLAPGRTTECFLWRDWTLATRQVRGSRLVGVFNRGMPLSDFREACFATLEEGH